MRKGPIEVMSLGFKWLILSDIKLDIHMKRAVSAYRSGHVDAKKKKTSADQLLKKEFRDAVLGLFKPCLDTERYMRDLAGLIVKAMLALLEK